MKYEKYVDFALARIIERIINEASQDSVIDGLYKISPSTIHGVGIHAAVRIPKGTCLGISHIRNSSGRYSSTPLGSYHNHSYAPNTINVSDGDVRRLYVISDVKPEDEITVDYTMQPDLEQPESF